jgi:hypothetical protein
MYGHDFLESLNEPSDEPFIKAHSPHSNSAMRTPISDPPNSKHGPEKEALFLGKAGSFAIIVQYMTLLENNAGISELKMRSPGIAAFRTRLVPFSPRDPIC